MSRQRIIDPACWTSDDFTSVSRDARQLMIGMISHQDDEGRGQGSSRSLKAKVFPTDVDVTVEMVRAWIDELHRSQMALFYEVGGSVYYWLPKHHKYQRPRHPVPSRIPPYQEHLDIRNRQKPDLPVDEKANSVSAVQQRRLPEAVPDTAVGLRPRRDQEGSDLEGRDLEGAVGNGRGDPANSGERSPLRRVAVNTSGFSDLEKVASRPIELLKYGRKGPRSPPTGG